MREIRIPKGRKEFRLIDCGDSVEFSQFYMAHITHNYTEVNWTTGGKKKEKNHAEGFFYQTNTGSTILEINVLNEHSTRGGEQLILR